MQRSQIVLLVGSVLLLAAIALPQWRLEPVSVDDEYRHARSQVPLKQIVIGTLPAPIAFLADAAWEKVSSRHSDSQWRFIFGQVFRNARLRIDFEINLPSLFLVILPTAGLFYWLKPPLAGRGKGVEANARALVAYAPEMRP